MRVYVLWAPRGVGVDTNGPLVMQALAQRLDGSVLGTGDGGFGIPVGHRHAPWRPKGGSSAPRPIDFDRAQCNVIIAIYDDVMAAREDWSAYLRSTYDAFSRRGNADLLIPILFTADKTSPPEWPR